jgi:hypothetical protein
MKIRFLQTYTVKADGGETYKEGKVYDLPDPTAQHFLKKRGRAVPCDSEPEGADATPDKESAVQLPEERELGGGKDPVKTFTKAQRASRKKALQK